jgi:hypothetical protein
MKTDIFAFKYRGESGKSTTRGVSDLIHPLASGTRRAAEVRKGESVSLTPIRQLK